jgi:hypothetical protein
MKTQKSLFKTTLISYTMKTFKKNILPILLVLTALFIIGSSCTPGLSCEKDTFYADKDGDGFGDLDSPITTCGQPEFYVLDSTDCDDNNPNVNPDAIEIIGNGIDDNCNGIVDECNIDSDCGANEGCINGFCQELITYYADQDDDGFGDANNTTISGTTPPAGYVTNDTDCDDTNPQVHPGAEELCDGIDNDCDGVVDGVVIDCGASEVCVNGVCVEGYVYYQDNDGDGFGNSAVTTTGGDPNPPTGWSLWTGDCDDQNPEVNVLANEIMGNGIDDNCNGLIDAEDIRYIDVDGDGYGSQQEAAASGVFNNLDCDDNDQGIHPYNVDSIGDGVDNNCDGIDG